jgi:pilus assembly protein CpaD
MDKLSFFRSPGPAAAALCLFLALTPASAREVERGVEPAHQPTVERTDFVFDVAPDGAGGLGRADEQRLSVWFRALGLGYGDHVTLAGADRGGRALHDGIAQVVGRHGLLIEGEAPATAGEPPMGGVRVVVSRSVASVPGCPSWRDKAEADFAGGLSDNYGCASATNLAAMVADPRDLVDGRRSGIDPAGVVSGKAIRAYRDKAPTGAGDLQGMSVGGN